MARGGPRPGAGRPKDAKTLTDEQRAANAAGLSPLDYMLSVMNDEGADPLRRDQMAIAAAPFIHALPRPPSKPPHPLDRYLPPAVRGNI